MIDPLARLLSGNKQTNASRVGLGNFLLLRMLLEIAVVVKNSGEPKEKCASGFEYSRKISALETHSAGPYSSRQPPHNNGTLKPEA